MQTSCDSRSDKRSRDCDRTDLLINELHMLHNEARLGNLLAVIVVDQKPKLENWSESLEMRQQVNLVKILRDVLDENLDAVLRCLILYVVQRIFPDSEIWNRWNLLSLTIQRSIYYLQPFVCTTLLR